MSDHPIESMMNTTMEKIKTMVDASTMIGDPITTPDGTVIIPVSKVSYGFASAVRILSRRTLPARICSAAGRALGLP